MKNENPIAKPKLSAERLREVLLYDPKTGIFTWLARRQKVSPGAVAGTNHSEGYRRIVVDSKFYYAHRLAWLYVNGNWPANSIDHIDGDRSNNRISNLRDASDDVNSQNLHGAQINNKTSGLLGVCFSKNAGKFHAQITHKRKPIHLGFFDDKNDAHQAYLDAKRRIHEGCTI